MSSVNDRAYDFTLTSNRTTRGFLLWRFGEGQARAWQRRGESDTASRRSDEDLKYSKLPDEIEFAAVYNDFSGGYGYAYRRAQNISGIHWSQNMDTRFPRQAVHCQALQLLPQAAYASTNINCEYLIDVPLRGVSDPPAGTGTVLAVGKGYIASYTPNTLTTVGSMFSRVYEATGAGVTFGWRPAVYGSYTYIPVTTGSSFYRRAHDGASFTLGPNQPAQVFLNSGDRLAFAWKDAGGAHIRTIAQGVANDAMATGNYSATINIGPGNLQPTDMIDRDRQIFIGMSNGLHAGDSSGTFVNVLPEMKSHQHEHNAADLVVYNTEIQVPHMDGLWSFTPSTFVASARETGPANRGDRSPIHGHIHPVRGLGPWLYAGLWTGTSSFILAGMDQMDGTRRWNVMQRLPHAADISRIHFDSINVPSGGVGLIPGRMWVATHQNTNPGATSPLYVCPIPKSNDNPLALDANFTPNYVGSARMDMGRDDRGAPATPKVFRAVEVRADMLLSGVRYLDVYYTVDGGNRVYLGRANDSPRSILSFPGLNGNFVSGHDIELSLESFTSTPTISPVYYEVVVRGAIRPKTVDEITAVVRIADGLRNRRSTPMPSAAEMARDLRAMAGTVNPVYLMDLNGNSSWVLINPSVQEAEAYQVGEQVPETQMTIRMAVLDFTSNMGTTWDDVSDMTWSAASIYTWAQIANLST
jgi:hypothetical protein